MFLLLNGKRLRKVLRAHPGTQSAEDLLRLALRES